MFDSFGREFWWHAVTPTLAETRRYTSQHEQNHNH
jgi:hypothetical protein